MTYRITCDLSGHKDLAIEQQAVCEALNDLSSLRCKWRRRAQQLLR